MATEEQNRRANAGADAPPRCAGQIFGERVQNWQCTRRGYAKSADGKWYCKQHHPETMEAKQKARDEAWRRQNDANEEAHARAAGYVEELGIGTVHYEHGYGTRPGRYNGGIELTEEETIALIEYLKMPEDARRWSGWALWLEDWKQRRADRKVGSDA